MDRFDIAVIGGGMAGACAAHALARQHRVVLVERESQPGYHSTGRSAAMYVETYGNAGVRALTVAGRDFFKLPPAEFAEHPLVTARGSMFVGSAAQSTLVRQMHDESRALSPSIRLISAQEALTRCPALRADPETKQVSSILVKRGKEWHEADRMYLNPSQIVFVEPVGKDSKVAQLIQQAGR